MNIRKKEVRKKIEDSLLHSLQSLEVSKPNKKAKKAIQKASKKLGDEVRTELKRKMKIDATNIAPKKTK